MSGLSSSIPAQSFGATAAGMGIQFGLNTASGLINQAFAKRNANIQAEYNKELMDYQAQLQQEAIDRQNAYNSPAAQMQRFQEAGLNPNLIYGQGSPGNQTTAVKPQSNSPANYQNVTSSFSNLMNGINIVQALAQMQDTINKTKISGAQANVLSKQATLTDVNANIARWKYLNILPAYKEELNLKNEGLGYDNAIMKHRALYASDNALSESLLKEYQADLMYQDYLFSLSRYSNYSRDSYADYKLKLLEMQHKRQAITNMESQNTIFGLQNTALYLNNQFTQWYNQYRSKYRRNLYTPHSAFAHYYGNMFNFDKYLNYGF